MEVIAMIGPLVYDLAKQHVSELLAERDMDRLGAQAPRTSRTPRPRIDVHRWFPPLSLNRGSAASNA
jgi:hypothetical protein